MSKARARARSAPLSSATAAETTYLQLLSSRQQRSAPLEVTEDARKGSWVSSHFSSRKYSGRFDQPIHRLIREDGIIPNQLRLTPSQRAEYFLNSLEGATWESHPD